MSRSETDDRVAVKTYVPREQKWIWADHAEDLNMTMSEYIRTMVQSGRSPFTVEGTVEEPTSSDTNPRGDDLETAILDVLQDGPATFDELSEEIIGELEADLDRTLMEMEQVNVRGRSGEYFLES